jgi:hypothetical protein
MIQIHTGAHTTRIHKHTNIHKHNTDMHRHTYTHTQTQTHAHTHTHTGVGVLTPLLLEVVLRLHRLLPLAAELQGVAFTGGRMGVPTLWLLSAVCCLLSAVCCLLAAVAFKGVMKGVPTLFLLSAVCWQRWPTRGRGGGGGDHTNTIYEHLQGRGRGGYPHHVQTILMP